MSGKRTKAPWTADMNWVFGNARIVSSDPRRPVVADVLGSGTTGERCFYDAYLIAAAPDLLDAMAVARAAIHQFYTDWDGEPEDMVELQGARSACDAAIAKALGK